MKKKIGIITLNGYKNFGNRLQNYALQETLKNLGLDVTTILTYENESSKQKKFNLIIFAKMIKYLFPKHRNEKLLDSIRNKTFQDFSKIHIT